MGLKYITSIILMIASIAIAGEETVWMSIKTSEFPSFEDKAAPYFRNLYGDDFILQEAGWAYPTNWNDYTKLEQRVIINDYLSTNETYYSWIFAGWESTYCLATDTNIDYSVVGYWRLYSLERRAKESAKKLGEAQPDIITNITAELLDTIEKTVAKVSTKTFKISFDKSHVTNGLTERVTEDQ